jgi:hypothetical protein
VPVHLPGGARRIKLPREDTGTESAELRPCRSAFGRNDLFKDEVPRAGAQSALSFSARDVTAGPSNSGRSPRPGQHGRT